MTLTKKLAGLCALAVFTIGSAAQVLAAEPPAVSSQQLAPQLYLLKGAGGNMAALLGADGAVVIDAQFDFMAPGIRAELEKLQAGTSSNTGISTLINTHFHKDHTNGNAALAAGRTIIAHSAVLKRLKADDKFDVRGLPNQTFTGEKKLTINGQQLALTTMPVSHTDGDLIVWFPAHNVLHMGDLFFADRFPFIDLNSGGSVQGYLANVRQILAQTNDKTKIIPGHGDLMDKKGLARFLNMMEQTLAEVQAMRQQGLSVEQAVTKGLSAQWKSWSWNFITEEKWIRTLYQA